ncbi:MAG: RDD family protein [Proteobacteria bacterium]|nr:RDD family protein [Pseudomonadota bacterium]
MKWYYAIGKERMGPIEDAEFEACVKNGQITEKTMVWNSTLPGWKRLMEVPDYLGKTQTPEAVPDMPAEGAPVPQGQCSECGRSLPEDELVRFEHARVCAACKPLFVQKLKEGVAVGGLVYGGFWIRFAAKFIDGLILAVVNMAISGVMAGMMMSTLEDPAAAIQYTLSLGFLQILVAASYSSFFLGKFSATPGKMACGLKVITADNEAVSYLRGFGRYFAELVSGMILCIGYLMAAWDEEKRALHDRICNTRVIKKSGL